MDNGSRRAMRFAAHVCAFAALLLLSSCGRPETIGRGELKRIFKEAFLVNAYYNERGQRQIALDSLDVYRPILERHGYRVKDLEHTVGVFARKKSANLSKVVEQAIEELKAESAYYDSRLAGIDSLYTRSARALRREVLRRDSIVVRRVADTSKLKITMPAEEGTYEISYSWLVDTLDKNRSLRATFTLVDSAGRRSLAEAEPMARRGERQRPPVVTVEADSTAKELEISMGNYPQKGVQRPYVRVDSLRVVYYPPRERALDSLAARWNDLGKYGYKAHSGALRPNPPWPDTLAVGGAR
jgi:hypothetical protein